MVVWCCVGAACIAIMLARRLARRARGLFLTQQLDQIKSLTPSRKHRVSLPVDTRARAAQGSSSRAAKGGWLHLPQAAQEEGEEEEEGIMLRTPAGGGQRRRPLTVC